MANFSFSLKSKHLLLWVLLLFYFAKATAQQDTIYNLEKSAKIYQPNNYDDIFKKRYWHLFIRPLVSIQKGTIYKDNDFCFAVKSAPGFQFGGNISFGIPKRFALETGFNVEVNYFNYYASTRKNYYNGNAESNAFSNDLNYLGFIAPIYVNYRIPINNKKNNFFIEAKLGFDLKYGITSKLWVSNYAEMPDSFFLFTSYINKGGNDPKIGVKYSVSASIVAGIGFNFILKNQRILHFQIIGTYNPFINDNGTITFVPDSPYEKVIPFRNYINTLGFELNYRFTKYPKRQKGFKASLKEEYRRKPVRELK